MYVASISPAKIQKVRNRISKVLVTLSKNKRGVILRDGGSNIQVKYLLKSFRDCLVRRIRRQDMITLSYPI